MKVKGKQLEDTLRSSEAPFTAVYATEFIGGMDGSIRFKCKNAESDALAKGEVVYISGVSGDVPEVQRADADGAGTMPAVGLCESSANASAEVYIVSFGNLTGMNTSALNTTSPSVSIVGRPVYVSTTSGELTIDPPAGSTAKLQNIGQIVREHSSEGIIKVGGAGRTAATPNLDEGHFFIGDANNQSIESAYQLPLTVGTSGQVLTSNGTNITFQDASGASAPTSLTASVAVGDFTPTHWITDPSNATVFTINLPTTRYEITQAFSNDGETFIIENPSKAVVTLRISDAQQFINDEYYQSFIRHEGDYDDQGVGTGEPLTYNIQPLTNVKVHIKKEYEVDGTPYSFNINRIVYHVVVGGL